MDNSVQSGLMTDNCQTYFRKDGTILINDIEIGLLYSGVHPGHYCLISDIDGRASICSYVFFDPEAEYNLEELYIAQLKQAGYVPNKLTVLYSGPIEIHHGSGGAVYFTGADQSELFQFDYYDLPEDLFDYITSARLTAGADNEICYNANIIDDSVCDYIYTKVPKTLRHQFGMDIISLFMFP